MATKGVLAVFVSLLLGVVAAQAVRMRQHQSRLEHEVKEAVERLAIREDFLGKVFESAPIGISVSDPKGNIVYANQRSQEILGLTPEVILRRPIGSPEWTIVRPDGSPMPVDEYASVRAMRDNRAVDGVEMGIVGTDRIRWIRVNAVPSPDPRFGVVVAYVDVTEVKEATLKLKDFSRDVETFLDQTTDFVYFKDENSQFRFASQALARITGHADWRQLIGKHDREVFPEDVAAVYEVEEFAVFAKGKALINRVDPYYDENGRPGQVLTNKWPVFDEAGKVVGIFGISRDISELIATQAALAASESRLRSYIENAPMGIFVVDQDRRHIDANPAACALIGCSREEIVGVTTIEDVIEPEHANAVLERFGQLMKDGRADFSTVVRHHDGHSIPVYVKAVRLTDGQAMAFVSDVTERIRLEDNLRDERERLAAILEGTNAGTWEWNVQTGETRFNESWAEIVGYRLEELAPVSIDTWSRLAHPDDLKASGELLQRHFDGLLPYYEFESRMRHKNGHWIWVLDRGKVTRRDAAGQPLLMSGTHQEITRRKQAEAALQDSEARFRQLFEQSGSMMMLVDPEHGDIIDANAATARFYGYEKSRMIGMNLSLINELPRDELTRELARAARSERNRFSFVHRLASGDLRDVEVYSSAILVSGQSILLLIVHDVTARRRSERRLNHLLEEQKAVLQSEVVGFAMIKGRRVTWCNGQFARMLGYQPDEIIGQLTRMFYENDAEYENFAIDTYPEILAGGVYRAQERYRCKDGRMGWFDVSGALLHPGSDDCIWAFVDISDQKRAELALIRAGNAAEQANVAKSQFLATMSHEIRTPMNGILGMAQLLMMPDLSADERERYTRTIYHSGQALLSLLNDILDLSKVDAGRIELESIPFKPAQILDEMTTLFGGDCLRKALEISVQCTGAQADGHFRGDPMRMRQIVANLFSNAIKFTPQGGRIGLTLDVPNPPSPGERSVLRFAVSDTGIGIAQAQMGKLFQPFSQVDGSITRRFGGTGLGLAITRSLVELMGGRVGVDSVLGAGSTFWFEVPLESFDGPVADSPRHALSHETPREVLTVPDDARRHTILMVEDVPNNRLVVETYLRKRGFVVHAVEDGQQALDWLAAHRAPDLVLMDCQMPILDGLEATRRIRAREAASGEPARLPIVALTAGAFDEDRENCRLAGMDDFLAKPVVLSALDDVLARCLPATEGAASGLPEAFASADAPAIRLASASVAEEPFDQALLAELDRLLERQTLQARQVCDRIARALDGTAPAAEFAPVVSAVSALRFDQARECLSAFSARNKGK